MYCYVWTPQLIKQDTYQFAEFIYRNLDEEKDLFLLNLLPDLYEHLITILLDEKSEIRFKDMSNALMNNDYWKFN